MVVGGHRALGHPVGGRSTPSPAGGGCSLTVGCLNAERAACGALTVFDANALAGDSVAKILLP